MVRGEINKVLGRTASAAVGNLHHAQDAARGQRRRCKVSVADRPRYFVAGHRLNVRIEHTPVTSRGERISSGGAERAQRVGRRSELLPRRQRRVRRVAGMAHIDLQKTIAAGKSIRDKVESHCIHAVSYLHARVGNGVGRTLQSARAHRCGVVQFELQIEEGIGRRRAVLGQAALIGES